MHRGDQLKSMRASGTTEEYDERVQLLQDIVSRIDDWKEDQNDKNSEIKEQKNAIESSGNTMRQYALGELCYGDSDDGYSSDNSNIYEQKSGKRSRGENKNKKLTKRQRLDSVTSSISSGLASLHQQDIDKYKYLNNRLEFDKEEAEKNRCYQERLEIRKAEFEMERIRYMAEIERQREERQAAAEALREEKRDKFLLEILTLLSDSKKR